MHPKSPNRVLSLDELNDPFFARTVAAMETLRSRESISWLHPSKRWEYPWALEQASLASGCRVLDAGCGASIFPVFLAKAGFAVSACDLHVPAGLGETHGIDIAYARGSLTALPFPDDRFSAVFCISVIEHLPLSDIPAAMEEFRRVLEPGGKLLLTTDFFRRTDAEVWYRGPGEPFRVDWNLFDEDRLRRFILKTPGFTVPGGIDLSVDWDAITPRMIDFHGYPYTSVGIALEKE